MFINFTEFENNVNRRRLDSYFMVFPFISDVYFQTLPWEVLKPRCSMCSVFSKDFLPANEANYWTQVANHLNAQRMRLCFQLWNANKAWKLYLIVDQFVLLYSWKIKKLVDWSIQRQPYILRRKTYNYRVCAAIYTVAFDYFGIYVFLSGKTTTAAERMLDETYFHVFIRVGSNCVFTWTIINSERQLPKTPSDG